MASRTPPRFVPTLTEVVQAAQTTAPAPAAPLSPEAQAHITRRVMQRVDLALERRLREAIATVVLEQTSSLTPLLRARVEAVVREIVAEAMAEEWQARQRGGPADV